MRILDRLFTKKKRFSDGSVLWPSGKEHFSFTDYAGKQVEFDVLYSSSSSDAINMIVSSSVVFSDRQAVPEKVKQEIILKARAYFEERGQRSIVVE